MEVMLEKTKDNRWSVCAIESSQAGHEIAVLDYARVIVTDLAGPTIVGEMQASWGLELLGDADARTIRGLGVGGTFYPRPVRALVYEEGGYRDEFGERVERGSVFILDGPSVYLELQPQHD